MGASASLLPSQLSRETVEALDSLSESAKAELNEKWASMQAATDEEKPAGSGSHEEKETVAAVEVSTPRQAKEESKATEADAAKAAAVKAEAEVPAPSTIPDGARVRKRKNSERR